MTPVIENIAKLECVIFCDLHDGGQLWSLPDHEMIECLNMYYDIMKSCMKDYFGVEIRGQEKETEDSSDTILCAFESVRMAVQFASAVHTKLLDVEWPQGLLKLRGMVIKDAGTEEDLCLYRGLRCRMAIDTIEQNTLFECIRRSTTIARYASGGHTLLSERSMQRLTAQEDQQTTKLDIAIQELQPIRVDGHNQQEQLVLVLPKRLSGRLYANLEGALPVMESALVNDLYQRLDTMQNTMDSVVRTKMRELDHEFYKLNSVMDLYKFVTKDNSDVTDNAYKELDKKHLALQTSLEVIRKETIGSMQKKMQQFEIEALKLNMAIISQFSMNKKRTTSKSPAPSPGREARSDSHTDIIVDDTSISGESALSVVRDHNAYMQKKLEELKKMQQQMEERINKQKENAAE
jgi:hypothetical protein